MTRSDPLTRKQRAELNRALGVTRDIIDVLDAMREGPTVGDLGMLEQALTAVALMTTGDSPGSGWKTDSVSSSVISDPTGNAAALDQYLNKLRENCLKLLLQLREDAYTLWKRQTLLASYLTERPHRPPAGQGECMIDGEFVPGIGNDRIKRGLCPKHYKRWQRAGCPEVVQYPEHPDVEGSPIRATFPGCEDVAVKAA